MAVADAAPTRVGAADQEDLPPIGIAKFRAAMRLIETLIEEKTDVFTATAARYRARHHEHAQTRPLSHVEAMAAAHQIAGDLDGPEIAGLAAEVQQSGLRATDPPAQQELLLAAGLGTASEFLDAALVFVALIEMPKRVFDEHRQQGEGDLRDALDKAVEEIHDADQPVAQVRERAIRAFGHFASAGGEDSGKAVALIKGLIKQALVTTMLAQESSGLSLSTDSPTPTGGATES